ncbi:DUF3263 domain-containing protein [Streptomyces noursei]|uniref:DUF3263 domain-containing protein n=1 Tax=Streptomyces noursei TaxID=1971 RepID=UPI0037F22712
MTAIPGSTLPKVVQPHDHVEPQPAPDPLRLTELDRKVIQFMRDNDEVVAPGCTGLLPDALAATIRNQLDMSAPRYFQHLRTLVLEVPAVWEIEPIRCRLFYDHMMRMRAIREGARPPYTNTLHEATLPPWSPAATCATT